MNVKGNCYLLLICTVVFGQEKSLKLDSFSVTRWWKPFLYHMEVPFLWGKHVFIVSCRLFPISYFVELLHFYLVQSNWPKIWTKNFFLKAFSFSILLKSALFSNTESIFRTTVLSSAHGKAKFKKHNLRFSKQYPIF